MNIRRKISVRRRRAFTLLELLIVIVILGVLVAVLAGNLFGSADKAKKDLTATAIQNISQKIEIYKLHCGMFPENLGQLIEPPGDEELKKKWAGPYIEKKQLLDGWDQEFQYKCPGQYNSNGFDLWSKGPDRQEGSEDDIKNWEKT